MKKEGNIMIKNIQTANDVYEAIKQIPPVSISILDFARKINNASNIKALNSITTQFLLYKRQKLQENVKFNMETKEMVRLIDVMINKKRSELKVRETVL
jgi:hypothetical protein